MVRHVHVIGIGAGNPDHITAEGIAALRTVDTVFVVDKGEETDVLVDVRRQICERHLEAGTYRWVTIPEAPRDRAPVDYGAEVRSWHAQRADRFEAAIDSELSEDGTGAILVWGDPSLYDSTLRVLDEVAERANVAFTHSVTAGVTSISALAAAHRLPIHRIGESVLITTGRRLVADDGWPAGIANAVVMLDGDCSFRHLVNRPGAEDLHIWWGAYLGMGFELLRSGPLVAVCDEIVATRQSARAEHGWIMDLYLLRR